jgi:dihydroneopterin aldolase
MYAEESILGSYFLVTAKVGIDPVAISSIEDTIDYEQLLFIIKTHFEKPTALLEELITRIEKDIRDKFEQTRYIYLSIQKMNPPLGVEVICSEVSLERHLIPPVHSPI